MLEYIKALFQSSESQMDEPDPVDVEAEIRLAACALLIELAYADEEFTDDERVHLVARGMGEANALIESRKGLWRRQTLLAAAARYRDLFADEKGRVPATFQIITLTGWAPHPSQQQPLKPGSASARLADALDTEEIPAGEKAKPG